MLIKCPRCLKQLNIAQAGVFNCPSCGNTVHVPPEFFEQQLSANQTPEQSVSPTGNQMPVVSKLKGRPRKSVQVLVDALEQSQALAKLQPKHHSPASQKRHPRLRLKETKLGSIYIVLLLILFIGIIAGGVWCWKHRNTLLSMPAKSEFVQEKDSTEESQEESSEIEQE